MKTDWIMKRKILWGVLILFALVMFMQQTMTPEGRERAKAREVQSTPAIRVQTVPAKPIDPTASYEKYKREAQERQEREAKFNAVNRGDISFCEAFKSDLQSITGISKPCLSDDPTYRAVRDGMRDALRR